MWFSINIFQNIKHQNHRNRFQKQQSKLKLLKHISKHNHALFFAKCCSGQISCTYSIQPRILQILQIVVQDNVLQLVPLDQLSEILQIVIPGKYIAFFWNCFSWQLCCKLWFLTTLLFFTNVYKSDVPDNSFFANCCPCCPWASGCKIPAAANIVIPGGGGGGRIFQYM